MSWLLILLLLLGFMVPSVTLASTRILLLDDIGTGEATFAFVKHHQDGVDLTARVTQACWDPDCKPYLYYSTGLLKEFSRKNRAVYYNGGGVPVSCGDTHGVFQRSKVLPACHVSVTPELVCTAWYKDGDCAGTTTKHRVYMSIP